MCPATECPPKTAQRAARQREQRPGCEHCRSIAGHAQKAADRHTAFQADARAPYAVQRTGQSHHHRKRTGAQQVAHRFGHLQARFGKQGRPLGHPLLGRARTYHHQKEQPDHFAFQQCAQRRVVLVARQRAQRHRANSTMLHSGSTAHSTGSSAQRPVPANAKYRVDSTTTPTWPQQ